MKKTVLLFVSLFCLCAGAWAQDDDFPELADHVVPLQHVVKEWHGQGLYTAGWDEKPTVKNYFTGLAYAYPNDLFQMVVSKMLGLGVDDALSAYVLDERNGYILGELGTETSPSVQMCYWNCQDGSRLIAVALQGYEYNEDETSDELFVSLNDIAFFRILGDELIWRPVPVRQLCGKDYDFLLYDSIELPRQGKDIRLIERFESGDEQITTLVWDGARFSAAAQ